MSATLLGPKHPCNPMARATPRTHRGRRGTRMLWLFAYLLACSSRKNPMGFLPCMIWINIDCFMTQDKALLSFIASESLPLNMGDYSFRRFFWLDKPDTRTELPLPPSLLCPRLAFVEGFWDCVPHTGYSLFDPDKKSWGWRRKS
jgi:hypothetical protein